MGKLTNKVVEAIIRSKGTEEQIVASIEAAHTRGPRRTAAVEPAPPPAVTDQQSESQPTTKRQNYRRRDMTPGDGASEGTRHMTSENPE